MSDETPGGSPPPSPEMNLWQRMNAIMGQLNWAPKKGRADELKFDFVTHNDLAAMVRPWLVKYGVVVTVNVVEAARSHIETIDKYGKVKIYHSVTMTVQFVWINADKPEERETVNCTGQGTGVNDMAYGIALSYIVKNHFLKMLLVPSGDDPEAHANTAAHDEAEAERLAKRGREERLRLHKKAVNMARQCGYPDPETAVKDWLTSQTGAMPFLEIPLDVFEQATEHFAEHPLDTPKGD